MDARATLPLVVSPIQMRPSLKTVGGNRHRSSERLAEFDRLDAHVESRHELTHWKVRRIDRQLRCRCTPVDELFQLLSRCDDFFANLF